MNHYEVFLSSKAEKQVDKLSDNVAKIILKASITLADDPSHQGVRNLKENCL
jgi:mRNA interferase RelE/StbE